MVFRLLTIACISTFVHHARAVDFGLIGGIGRVEITGTNTSSDANPEHGYRLGVTAKFDIADGFDLRLAALYSLRKYEIEGINEDTGDHDEYDVTFTYVDLPVLAQFHANEWLNFYIGPVIAFTMSSKVKGMQGGAPLDENLKDLANTSFFLAQAGVNFDFGRFGLDLFYEKGLTDVYKDDAKNTFDYIGVNFLFWLTYSDYNEDDWRPYRSYRFK